MSKHARVAPPSVATSIRWNIAVGPVTLIGNLALIALAVKVGGASPYGVWAICFGTVALLGQADLGFGTAVVSQFARMRSEGRLGDEEVAKRYAFWAFVGIAVVFSAGLAAGLSLYFGFFDSGLDSLWILIVVATAALAASFMARFYLSLTQSHGIFHVERVLSIAGLVLRASVLLYALAFSGGIVVVALSDPGALIILSVGAWSYCRAKGFLPVSLVIPRDTFYIFRSLYRFGFPTFVSGFATLLAIQLPLYFVGAIVGYAQAAAFSALTRVFASARAAFGWITGPRRPEVSRLSGGGGDHRIAVKNARSMVILAGFTTLVVAPLLVAGG